MEHDGLFVATHPDVYEPHDDTTLLARAVKKHAAPGMHVVEVGCGAGIVALTAARQGAQVTATDVNPAAVRLCRHNAKQNRLQVDVVETDLLHGLQGPIDLVAFNPPYLPTTDEDVVQGPLNLAFDGGLDGNVTVLRFVEQLGALQPAQVLIVHSSLSDPKPMQDAMAALGYRHEVVEEEKHFFERLWVRRFYL